MIIWRTCVCGVEFSPTDDLPLGRQSCCDPCRFHGRNPADDPAPGFPVVLCACGTEFVASQHEARSGRQLWCTPCRGARIMAVLAEARKVAA